MSIDDLIVDIAGNDMVNATKKFDAMMSDRLNAALDAKKIELAKSFGEEEEAAEIEEVETEDETLEADSEETETEAEEGDNEKVDDDEDVQTV